MILDDKFYGMPLFGAFCEICGINENIEIHEALTAYSFIKK